MLKDVFDLAEYQEKATFGLGCKLTLTRNTANAVLEKKTTHSTMLKLKLILWNGMYHIIQPVFQSKLYYLGKVQVRRLQKFNT